MTYSSTRMAVAAVMAAVTLLVGCRRATESLGDDRRAVWLDVSPAIGDPPRDPGDAFAIVQAYGADTLRVRGVSITFGNVPLVRGFPSAREIVDRLDTGVLRPWRGASSPEERAAPTEATELLEQALEREPLTIVATGPLTTLAAVLHRTPALAERIERLIIIGGPSRQGATPAIVSGAALDPDSLALILGTAVPVTVVAPDLSSGFWFEAADLDRLDRASGPVRLVTPMARGWLTAVAPREGPARFAAPAQLAVDVAAHPGQMRCEAAVATVEVRSGALLLEAAPSGRSVAWCHTADPGLRARVHADLASTRLVKAP